MNVSRTWEFTEWESKQKIRIEAIDGHRAWKILGQSQDLSTPHNWNISPVCACGKSGNGYHFCSEECQELDL